MHLIPRDMLLDAQGRVTFNPIPEIATLRESGPGVAGAAPQWTELAHHQNAAAAPPHSTGALPSGSSVEFRMNCSGAAKAGGGGQVGFDLLSESDHTKYVKVVYDYDAVELRIDHTHGGGADKAIVQTAPLRGGLDGNGANKVELVVLLDGALLEVFLNRRAVISSFATHVFAAGGSTSPADRSNFALAPPEGVTCSAAAWPLKKLTPPAPPPPAPPPPLPPSPPRHCSAAAAGTPGMYSCAAFNNASQLWHFNKDGTLSLASNPNLVLAVGPQKIPSDGKPQVMVVVNQKVIGGNVGGTAASSSASASSAKGGSVSSTAPGKSTPSSLSSSPTTILKFNFEPSTHAINVEGFNGCLDAVGHGTVDDTPLQVYPCGGSPNQKWNMPLQGGAAGRLTSVYNKDFQYGGACLTICL